MTPADVWDVIVQGLGRRPWEACARARACGAAHRATEEVTWSVHAAAA